MTSTGSISLDFRFESLRIAIPLNASPISWSDSRFNRELGI